MDRDARLLVGLRLDKQPFIDGAGGLFEGAQRGFAVEAKLNGAEVFGLAVVALQGSIGVALSAHARPQGGMVPLELTFLDDEGIRRDDIEVPCVVAPNDAESLREVLLERLDLSLSNGRVLLERAQEMFPKLRFGDRACEQIDALHGTEPVFRQLVWHLRVLNQT
ncbi:MAG: hypothetical protein HC927_08025 [Deltaproteobacteria bacterium]|nr:hypothetical protein [Deltaproteobacteria bacterium]